MEHLHLINLSKKYPGNPSPVVNAIHMEIAKGSITAIVGKSGSGKSTLARLIAGLETPDSGSIVMGEQVLVDQVRFVPPEKRKIGLVFQDYALFPHLNVAKNVGYGLEGKNNLHDRVSEVLTLVGLKDYSSRYPHQLSGGQQQRVAIARALAPKPQLFILDEPFSNLDNHLKSSLRQEIRRIVKSVNITMIFITHDLHDAIDIADELIFLQEGRL
ncbi:MAG: ABC transporter ATP-binding protein, partial [Bacteroidota bacterium]